MADIRRSRSEPVSKLDWAKRPRSPLAGPYGHPFHPFLVTIPIGSWIASLVFDIAGRAQGMEGAALIDGAQWLVGIGIVGALLAALVGVLDLMAIPRGTAAFRTALTHMALNLTVVALFVVSFIIRLGESPSQPSAVALVLSIVGLAVLGVSGWLGGKLAYHYGVRVAAETTQAEGFRPERGR